MLKHYKLHHESKESEDSHKHDWERLGSVNYKDRFAQTALDEAVRQYQGKYNETTKTVIQLLIDNGAKSCAKREEHTKKNTRLFKYGMQLCKAGAAGDMKSLEALLEESRAMYDTESDKLNTGDWDGRTALHLAAVGTINQGPTRRHVDCVEWLLKPEHHVNHTIKDKITGDTPLDGAKATLKRFTEQKAPNGAIDNLNEIIRILSQQTSSPAKGWFKARVPPEIESIDTPFLSGSTNF